MKNNFNNMRGISSIAVASAGLMVSCAAPNQSEQARPNVLLILTDDQGWGDFGFNGNEIIRTPVLDSLCGESAHLTNFYVSPLSASTRAGILTGRDHLRTGAMSVTRASENMDEREQTVAEVLKANGYTTGCFGKWHNGAHYPQDPNGQGFDEFVGFCSGHLTNYFDARLQHNQEFFTANGYITDVLTDRAIEFIDKSKAEQTPFFCYVPYNAPHSPYQAPAEYYERYSEFEKSGEIDPMAAAVYAMCENLDYNIGRLLNYLSEQNLDENTIILFMSDNGPNTPRYNGELRGIKSMSYDGGFKVPCLIYWKGRIESVKLPQTASYIDIMPTILDLCGIESTPADGREISGVSLKGILSEGDEQLEPRYLFTHRSRSDLELKKGDGVIYNAEHKLITFVNGERELYDKISDPSETKNLLDEQPELANKLISLYDQWFEGVEQEYQRSISRTAQIGLLDTSVELPTHEALMSGRTRYNANKNGWAGDWMIDMSVKDHIYWDVLVAQEADYQITLQYATSGSKSHKIELKGSDKGAVTLEPYTAQTIESPDLCPRAEAYEQLWGEQVIGTIHLSEGKARLELLFNANSDLECGALEVKGIEILKLN